MFFLIRSSLCIGLVVSALPNGPGVGVASWAAGGSSALVGSHAVAALGRFCHDDAARCLLAAASSSEPARGAVSGRHKSRPATALATPSS